MASWDSLTTKQLTTQREAAVRTQVLDAVAPFSPFWRSRLSALGRTAKDVASLSGLRELPAAGERDVCPDGNPSGAAGLVLQAKESGYALHADGPALRKALGRRLTKPDDYREIVEADTRPTSYVYAGQALRFPVASTRSDLDVVARTGARLWQVLGLSRADIVVSALPAASSALVQALSLAALGASSPLFAPGGQVEHVVSTLNMVDATVLVLPAVGGAELLGHLTDVGAAMSSVTTVLVAGPPDPRERSAIADAMAGIRGSRPVLLAVHVPDGHRLPWAECRESGGRTGLHTYPDLEVVETIDPETGEQAGRQGPYEVVLTQLGLRGTALLRWRTGDVADAVEEEACPSCGRTVPRVLGLHGGALVPQLMLRTGPLAADLRAIASALSGRPDVKDWRVVIGRSVRDGTDELFVHVLPPGGVEQADVAVAVARDLRLAAGMLPSQVIVSDDGRLPDGTGLSERLLT
jgi:phenylacetate-coenzyme A ligase PaaK-like adenylate-forming protein